MRPLLSTVCAKEVKYKIPAISVQIYCISRFMHPIYVSEVLPCDEGSVPCCCSLVFSSFGVLEPRSSMAPLSASHVQRGASEDFFPCFP